MDESAPPPVYGPGGANSGYSEVAVRPWTGMLRNVNVVGYLQGLSLLAVVQNIITLCVAGLLIYLCVRVNDKDISVAGRLINGGSDKTSVTATTDNVVMLCQDLLCEQMVSRRTSYQCLRPNKMPIDVLSTADAWVLLGDEFAAGAPSSSDSWWSELMSRASTLASNQISVYNEAGPGVGQISNLTLQVRALRHDTTAAAFLSSTSQARVVVFVSIGRKADSDTLANTLEEMLESLWHGKDALVTAHNADRFTVFLIAPPDPYWGATSPSASYRSDVVSTCTHPSSWWQQKLWRQQTNQILAASAARNNAAFVDLSHVLGRFSLASTGTIGAFETRCSADDSTPRCNQRGQYATSEAVWQCASTTEGIYDIPDSA